MNIFKRLFRGQQLRKANQPLLDGSHGSLIVAFRERIAQRIDWEKLNDVEFAMWLPSENDNQFSNSEFINIWMEIFSLTSKYWSYITADLLKTLKVAEEREMRLALPEEDMSFAFLTGEDEQVVLSLSVEKGIRFHFASTTPLNYRVSFLKDFLNYCRGWEGLVNKLNQPVDENVGFSEWWSSMVKISKITDINEPILAVGKIIK